MSRRVWVVSDSRGPLAAYTQAAPAMAYAQSLRSAGVAMVKVATVAVHSPAGSERALHDRYLGGAGR